MSEIDTLRKNGLRPRVYQYNFDRDGDRHAVVVTSKQYYRSRSWSEHTILFDNEKNVVLAFNPVTTYNLLEKDKNVIFARNARGVTVATIKDEDNNLVGFGAAITSNKDNFVRRQGYSKAIGRALANIT